MVPYLRWDDRVGAWRTGKTEIALAWRCACPLICLEHRITYAVVNSGDGAQAIIVTNDPFFAPDRAKLVQFTASKRLPAPP